MGWVCRQLALEERRRVYRMVGMRRPVAEIAASLGRHRSTVYREIRRNRVAVEREQRRHHYAEHASWDGYCPLTAHDLARRRRQRLQSHGLLRRCACTSSPS